MLEDLPSKEEEYPPLSDKRWARWSRPLLAYLARPRRWPAMSAWASGLKVNETQLRQLAAYLEESDEAESVNHWGRTVWRQRKERPDDWAVKLAPEPDVEEEAEDGDG